jgi:hypothetical protein
MQKRLNKSEPKEEEYDDDDDNTYPDSDCSSSGI